MVVEVTLQDVKGRHQPKNKACWFPFKKQYDNRKKAGWQAEDYDYDGVDWGNGGSPSNQKVGNNKKHGRRKRGGSVSTGTDASSYGGYSNESSPNRGGYDTSLASQSHFSSKRNLSHLSYQTGNTSFVEEACMSSNNSVVRSIASLDDEDSILEMGPDGMPIEHDPQRNSPVDSFPLQLAMVETNCMARTFWIDEMVEGGAFACLQQQPTKTTEQTSIEVQMTPSKDRKGVTFDAALGGKDFKIVQEVNEPQQPNQLDQHIQQRLLEVNHEDASPSRPKGLQYVTQEPENIQQGPALQRAICSRVRLGNRDKGKNQRLQQQKHSPKNSSFSQISSISSSQPSSQNQTDSSGSTSVEASFLRGGATLKRGSLGDAEVLPSSSSSRQQSLSSQHGSQAQHPQPMECFSQPCANYASSAPRNFTTPEDEKDAPNFYVEVEAMREQLNGIRDLEIIEAEDKQLEQEIGLARTSSLVDGDSTFMDSVFEDASESEQIPQPKTKTLETKAKVKNRGKFGFWKRSRSAQQGRVSEKSLPPGPEQKGSAPTAERASSSRQLDDRSRLIHSTPDRPIMRGSSARAKDSMRRNSGPVDIDELSISQRVAERLKKMEKEQSTPKQNDAPAASPAAAKYYQRRSMLGLGEINDSPDRFAKRNVSPEPSPSPTASESSPSSNERLDGRSSPSLECMEVKPTEQSSTAGERKMSPHRRVAAKSSPNHRGISSDYRGRMETNVAQDAYFGLQQSKVNEFADSTSLEFNAFGDNNDQNQITAPAPNFGDDFWKDDDTSEIKTAAFEEYDGDDSLFGDLRSNAESKVSKEGSQPSQMSFPNQDDLFNNFNAPLNESEGSEDINESGDTTDFDKFSRADQSKYTNADQSEYTRYTADYTEDPSRYTVEDESRYHQDTSLYTTDFSRYSRHGDTSFVSRTSRGADKSFVSKTSRGTLTTNATNDVSAYLDEGDGQFVAAIDKWLY